jgi:hypothetical protein
MNVINERNLVIAGIVSLVFLYYIRRKERYEPVVTGAPPPPDPNLNYLKPKIADCRGDSECIKKAMFGYARSGMKNKMVAPSNEAS